MYAFFFYRLLDSGVHADVEFVVHGEKFSAHRCILSVRCSYFAELFRTKWEGRYSIELRHKLVCASLCLSLFSSISLCMSFISACLFLLPSLHLTCLCSLPPFTLSLSFSPPLSLSLSLSLSLPPPSFKKL